MKQVKETGARRFFLPAASALLGAALLLGSCSKDDPSVPGGDPDGMRGLTLTLAPQDAVEVEVRSADAAGLNEINDLWVIQLDEAGSTRLADPVYLSGGELPAPGSNGEIVLEEFKPLLSRIYAIANTHDATLYRNVTSEADILAVQGTGLTAATLTANGAPMAGSVTLTSVVNEVTIPLYRAVAKVNFSWKCALPSGESFTPSMIHLRQVPSMLNYFRNYDNLPDAPYPAVSSGPVVAEWLSESISGVIPATGSTFTWYLPENVRGTGTAAVAAEKNFSTAPSGQADYCTVAIVCGTYTTATTSRDVSYHFYLGGDNVADYNLLRNREYDVTATITGINDADMRVLIETSDPVVDAGYYYADWSNVGHLHDREGIYTGWVVFAEAPLSDEYTYDEAQTACPEGWRLPTAKEFGLYFCMTPSPLSDASYLCRPSSSGGAPVYLIIFSNASYVMFDEVSSSDAKYSVHCVRDL